MLSPFGGKKVNDSYNNNDFKSDIGLVSGKFQENLRNERCGCLLDRTKGLEQTRNNIVTRIE